MAITNYWSSAVSLTTEFRPGELPSTLPDPKSVTLTQFMNWSLDAQVAYIEAKGTGTTPKTVTILDPGQSGDTGYPKPTISLSYTTSPKSVTFPTSSPLLLPENVSPSNFVAWTRDSQVAYINQFGEGTPKAVYLGPNGSKAELVANGGVQLSAGVIVPTSGDAEPIPYYYMSGSAAGTPSSVVSTSAEWLFPSLDGENEKLPVEDRPEMFDFDVTADGLSDEDKKEFLAEFAKWHSAYQLEYIKTHGAGTPKKLEVNDQDGNPLLTALVSPEDPTKRIIVESLDKAAIARMTNAEQAAVAATTAFVGRMNSGGAMIFEGLATRLGLALVDAASLDAHGANVNGGTLTLNVAAGTDRTPVQYIDELKYAIANTTAPNRPFADRYLPIDAQDAFIDQLVILEQQVMNSAIVSPSDIKKKVDELRERFNRLFAFYNVKGPTDEIAYTNDNARDGNSGDDNYNNSNESMSDDRITVYRDVITQNGDLSGINKGYQVFLAQEKRIAELAEARMDLVRDNGIFNGKNLDVPYLVYKFQSLYNLSLEAQVVAETEEVNQKNDLLKTYAAIQDIVNQTLAKFPKADDTKKRLFGLNSDEYNKLTSAQQYAVAMFEDILGSGQKHPLEILNGLNRPLSEFYAQKGHDVDDNDTTDHHHYDLAEGTHTQWSTIGTRLSETVTLINQNSQIKMNDINSMDKERNRHFELANSALSKMADIIANIARAGG